jgi:hypothetical protein
MMTCPDKPLERVERATEIVALGLRKRLQRLDEPLDPPPPAFLEHVHPSCCGADADDAPVGGISLPLDESFALER